MSFYAISTFKREGRSSHTKENIGSQRKNNQFNEYIFILKEEKKITVFICCKFLHIGMTPGIN
jgi:hypothetical protein